MPENITGAVCVVGGGIAAIQASLDLASSGYKVFVVEKSPSIGGHMAMLDKTFPTNDCSMCIMSPKLVEVGRHPNIELVTLAQITGISGEKGNFTLRVHQKARYIDTTKCIACGLCAEKCPKKVQDSFNQGLVKRKAIYVPYPQAVPLKYAIDADNCIKLTKGKCGNCAKVCPAGAVDYEDRDRDRTIKVGAVILAPGFKAYDPSGLENLGYSDSQNIVTSLEFERLLSASGPTSGHLMRASDKKEPKKIAWLQCVGSRDQNQCGNSYCSSVCCMYAIKQAIIAKEHAPYPLDCSVFYMDMRTHGKGFEDCYNQARDKHGVRFVRCRVHSAVPDPETGDVNLRYVNDVGELFDEACDMVVLSVGLEIPEEMKDLAKLLEVELTSGSFTRNGSFSPVATTRDGIYACGAFAGPKDIPQSVVEAGGAALCAGADLTRVRDTLIQRMEIPPETDIRGEPPRIGVFVCHCGINISGVVDVPGVAEYAKTLPFVEYASDNLYSCSQDTQESMSRVIREQGLNRIVVAACSPKTHEPLFQETLTAAGLNKYLFEFVNIRNHDSWVHKDNPEGATQKARDLVRMAVAKAAMLSPLNEAELSIDQSALVLGGGVSGMAAARALSSQGYPTVIVEQGPVLGGNARSLYKTALDEDVQQELAALIRSVQEDPAISVLTDAKLTHVEGFVGNFLSKVKVGEETREIEHGVTVIATGASEYKPDEYLYGADPRVVTGLELDRMFIEEDPRMAESGNAVFIQCVGSREPERPYCSRVCCTHSVLSAIHLKEKNPDRNVFVLYRDIRTYAERENLYARARKLGVQFVRFHVEQKPVVEVKDGRLEVSVVDHILNQPLVIETDLVCLAAAIVPHADEELAQFFKVPLAGDGFFVESHVKLAPSSFATDGVFLCGMAHYPKPIDESVAQAQAAVSAATTLLARKKIRTSGAVAKVDPAFCSSCGVCVTVCPYSAPSFLEEGPQAGKASINPVLCKGCGVCVASCRSGAIHLGGFDTGQILTMVQQM